MASKVAELFDTAIFLQNIARNVLSKNLKSANWQQHFLAYLPHFW